MSSADAVPQRPAAPAWRAWLQLARVSNTPTVVSNTVAGAVLAAVTADVATVIVVAVAMALFYTAGMILNDVLDEEIDRRDRPGAAAAVGPGLAARGRARRGGAVRRRGGAAGGPRTWPPPAPGSG